MKKIYIWIFIYVACISILYLLGIHGDQREISTYYALQFFTKTEITTGKDFFNTRLTIQTLLKVVIITILSAIVAKNYYSRFAGWLESKISIKVIKTFISLLVIILCIDLVRIPFNIAFYISAKKYDIIKSDFITWLTRYLSSNILTTLFIALALSILITIILKLKRYYLYIPAAFFLISIFVTIIYPRAVTPLFYEMSTIQDKNLENKISTLLKKADIQVKKIQVLHKSKYSSSVNAYMIGFGADKRIVLYDTLLNKFNHDEILAVLAHELCHYIEEHVLIGITLGSLGILAAFFLLRFFSRRVLAMEMHELLAIKNHPLLIICIIMLLFAGKPVENTLSRIMEKRADSFALQLTDNPDAFIRLKVRMAKENKSHLLPHPFYAWFTRSHPTILERIKKADILKKKKELQK